MLKAIRQFFERGRKGYCREDLWSFDNFLSNLLVKALKEFRISCHGYPSGDMTWEGWMNTLDEIIECFEEQCRDVDTNLPIREDGFALDEVWRARHKYQREKLHRGFELLERYYYDVWD